MTASVQFLARLRSLRVRTQGVTSSWFSNFPERFADFLASWGPKTALAIYGIFAIAAVVLFAMAQADFNTAAGY